MGIFFGDNGITNDELLSGLNDVGHMFNHIWDGTGMFRDTLKKTNIYPKLQIVLNLTGPGVYDVL